MSGKTRLIPGSGRAIALEYWRGKLKVVDQPIVGWIVHFDRGDELDDYDIVPVVPAPSTVGRFGCVAVLLDGGRVTCDGLDYLSRQFFIDEWTKRFADREQRDKEEDEAIQRKYEQMDKEDEERQRKLDANP